MNYSPFIYALDETNVGITGAGTLDGQADAQHWWAWRTQPDAVARTKLIQMAADGVPRRAARLRRRRRRCCGRTSSSRTAARTSSSRACRSSTRRCGKLNPVLCTNVTVRGVQHQQPRPEQRRLRSRVVPRRPDREVHVRHRRRLHRAQVGPQRRRPPAAHADRERHHPRLRHEGRPRRRDHRQRDLRRRAQHLRREVPHGQPAARSRAALQEQRGARRPDRAGRDARRDRRRGRRGGRRRRLLLRGRDATAPSSRCCATSTSGTSPASKSKHAFLLRGFAESPITQHPRQRLPLRRRRVRRTCSKA